MSNLWVLVANRGYAQILEVKGLGKEIRRIHFINHPDGRKKDGEINSDRPGRAFDRLGVGRHAYSNQVDPHTHILQQFAHELTELLKKEKEEGKFEELALICPADVMNHINAILPNDIKKCLVKEVQKDLPDYLSDEAVKAHIARYLNLWNYKAAA